MSKRLDLLLSHAYHLAADPREQEIMRPFPPLGLQYLIAWLREHDFENVDWFDTTFHPSVEAFHSYCALKDPRVVGLYGHTITRPTALGMARRCVAEGRRVIAGGPDPVQYLEQYLGAGVEVVVIGEGEQTLTELMEHLRDNDWQWDWTSLRDVAGIAFEVDGEVIRTESRPLIRPIDQIPWPNRERRDLDAYFAAWRARHGKTSLSMVTSRGCPYHCTWCSKQVFGDTFRRRSVDDVVDEVLYLKETYAPDELWFADDMFTINKRWVRDFCAAMVERGAEIPFTVIGRPETLSPEICDALRRAGCTRMYLSAESGAQHVLDAMRKEDTVGDILRGGRLLHEAGIELGVFVMIGYPGETRKDIDKTLQMLHRLQPEVTLLSVAHPMKGTQFYDEVADRIRLPPGWTEAMWQEKHGGRLPFRMNYSPRFYEWVQKMIWTETALVSKLRRREYDMELARLVAKAPLLRLGTRLAARDTGAEHLA